MLLAPNKKFTTLTIFWSSTFPKTENSHRKLPFARSFPTAYKWCGAKYLQIRGGRSISQIHYTAAKTWTCRWIVKGIDQQTFPPRLVVVEKTLKFRSTAPTGDSVLLKKEVEIISLSRRISGLGRANRCMYVYKHAYCARPLIMRDLDESGIMSVLKCLSFFSGMRMMR